MLNAKPGRNAPPAAEIRQFRGALLNHLKSLRGACDQATTEGDGIAASLENKLKQKGKSWQPDLWSSMQAGILQVLERATMDCLVRSDRLSEAARLIRSSKLRTRFATLLADTSLSLHHRDLRPALVLASAADWAGAEDLLKPRGRAAGGCRQEGTRHPHTRFPGRAMADG